MVQPFGILHLTILAIASHEEIVGNGVRLDTSRFHFCYHLKDLFRLPIESIVHDLHIICYHIRLASILQHILPQTFCLLGLLLLIHGID
uniref:Uncharacterized protein n=1 Tax=Arundo donax TaxID=35708 RepID=A0A0A9CLF6_ARUDO